MDDVIFAISTLYNDFDSAEGAFIHVDYMLPIEIIPSEVIKISGISIDALKTAITYWRIGFDLRIETDSAHRSTFDLLQNSAMQWARMAGHQRASTEISHLDTKYNNISQIVEFISTQMSRLGFHTIHTFKDRGDLYVVGVSSDRWGNRITCGIDIKIKYGGILRANIKFPVLPDRQPLQVTFYNLLGESLCNNLTLNCPQRIIFTADRNGTDFPALSHYFAIISTALSYIL